MDIARFRSTFDAYFPPSQIGSPSSHFEDPFTRSFFDLCFDVNGMASLKKQYLLKMAFGCLEAGECYLEVGTYQGKSLISAVKDNISRPAYACDNFSEFSDTNSIDRLYLNLKKFGILDKIRVFNSDFRLIMSRQHIIEPIGLFFYDGAHDEKSQYEAIKLVEPILSSEALVIVDDWRFAPDSQSYAKAATLRAIKGSGRTWNLLYDLPARFNGDHGMWWNGVAVFSVK